MSSDPSDSVPVPASALSGDAGPRILLFGGGTALNPIARALKRLTSRSIHLVPPFDSGGSSGSLRQHFGMPAVGDLRARMLALAGEEQTAATMARLLSHRFPTEGPVQPARQRLLPALDALLDAAPELAASRAAIELRQRLEQFAQGCSLDLRGASLGNLALTAAYLQQDRSLQRAGATIGAWLQLRGVVRCTVEDDLQLSARLSDGRILCGQHRITGKERAPLQARIEDTWLARPAQPEQAVSCRLAPDIAELIRQADLLVYAPGSFHSSLLAHFLPKGVGEAIAACPAPKLWLPNLGPDPELFGRSPLEALRLLQQRLGGDSPRLLSHVLIDASQQQDFAPRPAGPEWITDDLRVDDRPIHHPERVAERLLALARPAGSP